jgi:hypothetical protein
MPDEGAKTMSIPPGSRTALPADADDLRVEQIAAQLEEAEQQRLTDDWIERATLARSLARADRSATPPAEATMGRFQQGVANERCARSYSCWSGLSQLHIPTTGG